MKMNVFDKIMLGKENFVLKYKNDEYVSEWSWKHSYGKHYFKIKRWDSTWEGDDDDAILFLYYLNLYYENHFITINLLNKVNPSDYKDVFINSAKSLLKYAWDWYFNPPPLNFVDIYAEECMKDIEKLFEENNSWEQILRGIRKIFDKYNSICYSLKKKR